MDNDPKSGKFVKGNKAGKLKDPEMRVMRSAIKQELIGCVHSLLKPYLTLEEETAKGVSRYQYIMNKAVAQGNTKFLSWATEMAVGKAKQHIEHEGDIVPIGLTTVNDRNELVELIIAARKLKEKESTKD